jgi:FMN phosphatase YigB (HAD superfamily)
MIPLRIGFDMDGTLADLSAAYEEVEERLFGAELAEHDRPAPEAREAEQHDDEKVPSTEIASGARLRKRRTSGQR